MRIFILAILFTLFTAPYSHANDQNLELLDSNLIAKLHLADIPKDGQMVGAYVVSFRPKKGQSVNTITILLNPGLEFIKADAGRTPLAATSRVAAIQGMDMLELNVVDINLGKTLTGTNRIDIAIHYRGYLEELSWTGLTGVKETLHPDFTMLRAQSFAYPVFAQPTMSAIKKAWAGKAFLQFADVTLPGANEIVGSLNVAEKKLVGAKTKVTLKSNRTTSPMALAIAPYQNISSGPVTVSFLDGGRSGANRLLSAATAQISAMERLLGAPTSNAALNIIAVPNGYGTSAASGAIFVETGFFDAPSITPAIKKAIGDLWKSTNAGKAGNWSNGLDRVIDLLIYHPDMLAEFQMILLSTNKQLFASNKRLGKIALENYGIEGLSAEADEVSALAFTALHDILGREEFFKMVRGLRSSLNDGYVDMTTVAEFLQKNLKNKKARKFAKNWFSGKKAGKDINKAHNFLGMVKTYK